MVKLCFGTTCAIKVMKEPHSKVLETDCFIILCSLRLDLLADILKKPSAYYYGISVRDSQIMAHDALPRDDIVLGVRCGQEVTFSDKLSSVTPDWLIPASSPVTVVLSSRPTGFSFNRLHTHSGHLISLLGCIVTFVKAAPRVLFSSLSSAGEQCLPHRSIQLLINTIEAQSNMKSYDFLKYALQGLIQCLIYLFFLSFIERVKI